MRYTEIVEKARGYWETDLHGPYVCDNLAVVADEASPADFPELLAKTSRLKREVIDLIRGAYCVGQFLYPTRLKPGDTYLSDEEQEEARAFRSATLWPQLLTAAKALDKEEGEPANG